MTGLETLQARPRAAFDGTNTYGTFYPPVRQRSSWVAEITHLLFTQEREVEQNFERLCVSGQDNEL